MKKLWIGKLVLGCTDDYLIQLKPRLIIESSICKKGCFIHNILFINNYLVVVVINCHLF